MRIGINTRFLLKGKLEGIGVYTQEVASRLVTLLPQHEWFFFFDRPYADIFIPHERITPVVCYPPARHPALWYWWFEKNLPRQFSKHNIELFFSPDSYASLSTEIPQLLTVHDLAFEHYPQGIPWMVEKYYRYYTPRFCHKAQHILAISDFTAKDIIREYDIDPDKISVVNNGVSDIFKPLPEDRKIQVRQQFTRTNPYFIYVGAIHPRKNVLGILKAFESFKKQHPQLEHLLVIAGRKAWKNEALEQFYQEMTYKNCVIWLEHLPRQQVAELIAASTAMVYPSFYEGFGLPVLEAMSCGVPSITSRNSPMEEIAGDSGLICDPGDTELMGKYMYIYAHYRETREQAAKRALVLSEQYSWDITASRIAGIIEEKFS